MSRRQKSLKNQLQYALTKSSRIGQSKRADKKNGVPIEKYIYSVNRLDCLRDFASNFARFMSERFPEIKLVKDIEREHFEAFVQERGSQWSEATCTEYESRINKLGIVINNVFHLNKNFQIEITSTKSSDSGRDKMMSDEHLKKLREALEAGKTCARFVPLVGAAIGPRSEELRSIKPEDVDLKKGVVHLTNCKNGRNRTVPIRKEFLEDFKKMKDFLVRNNWETVTDGKNESAVNQAIRRALVKCGISDIYHKTSIHAIRKNFATHRYKEERAKGLSKKEAFTIVCKELGHNSYREYLFKKYIHL